jgi:hypothetical protein
VDNDFKTTDFTTLIKDPSKTVIKEDELREWEQIEWKRPSEFMPE